jgi:hypothetical protein
MGISSGISGEGPAQRSTLLEPPCSLVVIAKNFSFVGFLFENFLFLLVPGARVTPGCRHRAGNTHFPSSDLALPL